MLTGISKLLRIKHSWVFFALLFGLALLLPISYLDDMNYALGTGSLLDQQIQEYFTSHGRFLTHIVGRAILQNRWTADLLTALIAMAFLYAAALLADPRGEGFPSHTLFLWTALILLFPIGIWIPMGQIAHFVSYRLSFTLIAVFFLPYLSFFVSPNHKIPLWLVSLCGFLAGQTHEQAVVIAPLLCVAALFLGIQKVKIPLWFWAGAAASVLGNAVVLGSPYARSMDRLIIYGEVLNWDFFGQRLNWLELGPLRYLYSLAQVLVIWLPWSLLPAIIFGGIFYKCARIKGFFAPELRPPLFLFIASQAFTLVMMFSPRVSNSAISIGMDFLLVALFSILRIYGLEQGCQKSWGKSLIPWCYIILLIPLIAQLPAAVAYRREHWLFVDRLKRAENLGQKEIALRPFTRQGFNTPWGALRYIHPPENLQGMAEYQGFGNIKVIIDNNAPPY